MANYDYVKECSLYSHFGKSFYHEGMLDFVKYFICIYGDDHAVFNFSFVNVMYDIDWFVYIEPSLLTLWWIPLGRSIWSFL